MLCSAIAALGNVFVKEAGGKWRGQVRHGLISHVKDVGFYVQPEGKLLSVLSGAKGGAE